MNQKLDLNSTMRGDYNNAISYLEKSYKFKSENKQVDEYFKIKGREFENDEVGSFIYRIRQEDDNKACVSQERYDKTRNVE